MLTYIPGGYYGELDVFAIIFIITAIIMIIIMSVYCCILIRLHFLQRNLPKEQVVVMAPAYPAVPPHAVVYSTTPVTSMVSVQPESDQETPAAPKTPYYQHYYLVHMDRPPHGNHFYQPQQILTPAPTRLSC
ncbi:hypothetical protein RB195_018257 [Necator americanus]